MVKGATRHNSDTSTTQCYTTTLVATPQYRPSGKGGQAGRHNLRKASSHRSLHTLHSERYMPGLSGTIGLPNRAQSARQLPNNQQAAQISTVEPCVCDTNTHTRTHMHANTHSHTHKHKHTHQDTVAYTWKLEYETNMEHNSLTDNSWFTKPTITWDRHSAPQTLP